MTVYFDKENIRSLLKNSNAEERFQEVIRLIKKQLRLRLNFDLENINDEVLEDALLSEFTEGMPDTNKPIFSDIKVPLRPLPTSFDDIDNKEGIYLLDEDVDRLKRGFGVLIGGVGEEIDVLSSLFMRKDYNLQSNRGINENDFKNWGCLEEHILPFTDILIIDKFIFYSNNLPLLEYIYLPL